MAAVVSLTMQPPPQPPSHVTSIGSGRKVTEITDTPACLFYSHPPTAMPRLGSWLSFPSLTQMGTLLPHLRLAKQSWKLSKGSLLGNQGAWHGNRMLTGHQFGVPLGGKPSTGKAHLGGPGLQAWAPRDWGSAACPLASLHPALVSLVISLTLVL